MATTMPTGPNALSTSELLATADAFIAALASLDIEQMLALRTDDCQQVILPRSLERKPMSNEEFRAAYANYLTSARFAQYNITTHSTAVDARQQKVVLHASGEANTLAGAFKSEYVFWLTVVQGSGGKALLSRVEEFVDSKLAAEEGGKVRQAIVNAKEKETNEEKGAS